MNLPANRRATHLALTPEAIAAFAQIAQGQPASAVDPDALQQLIDVGLAVPRPGEQGSAMAVDPRRALPRWTAAILQDLGIRMRSIESVAGLESELLSAFIEGNPDVNFGGIERLKGLDAVNTRIDQLMANCVVELLTAQPSGPRDESTLEASYARDLDRVQRGVKMRTLYRDTVRPDEATARWAQRMTGAGVRIRTLARDFERMVILDRRVAIISDLTCNDSVRAVILHDPAVVAFLAAHFESEWNLADDWAGEIGPDASAELVPLSEEQLLLLDCLENGMTTQQMVKATGIATRTIGDRLKELSDLAGGANRFQLGSWAERQKQLRLRRLR